MIRQLVALLDGHEIGRLQQDNRSRLSFTYDETWRQSKDSFPVSLSMPLVAREHGHRPVEAFLWGLLPDNATIQQRWGQRFQVSPRNPFALMANVGEDCAGAVQFVRPDRLDATLGEGKQQVEWLSEADVADRLRALKTDEAAWRLPRDTGQFSLAGAQPKTALLSESGRWGVPAGRTPTTHILKPPISGYEGHAENEHFCMRLASELGLASARSQVMRFENEIAIVVERYDRRHSEKGFIRIHQEDICQALAILPTSKYENEGGPGAEKIIQLIRTVSSRPEDDVFRLVDALALNWLIGGTDAHAKNYSLLLGSSGQVRLAPLYDIASILPYDFDPQRVRLAMKIGGRYKVSAIGPRQWIKTAADLRLDADRILQRILDMAIKLPDCVAKVRRETETEGLNHPLLGRLADRLIENATRSRRLLEMRDTAVE
jgi:serine/threonine-protein kinase HipA